MAEAPEDEARRVGNNALPIVIILQICLDTLCYSQRGSDSYLYTGIRLKHDTQVYHHLDIPYTRLYLMRKEGHARSSYRHSLDNHV